MKETGDGGDLILKGNDLSVINGFQNMPYLGTFGGNPDQSTTGPKNPDEKAFDYWGNYLFSPNQPKIQFNSLLEKKLTETTISSDGRVQIQRAVQKDLSFMNDFSVVTVEVSIASVDRILIYIKIQEPDNLQSNEFVYIWDGTKQELTPIEND